MSFVALGATCAFLSLGASSPVAARMSLAEQEAYIGGEPAPVADPEDVWKLNSLCVAPSSQAEKTASECSKPDTACDQGNAYCAQNKTAGEACADSKEYKQPLECVTRDTTLKCKKNTGETVEKVTCYNLTVCACKLNMADNKLYCVTSDTKPANKISPCLVGAP